MRTTEYRSYDFHQSAHWCAGAFEGLSVDADGLSMAPPWQDVGIVGEPPDVSAADAPMLLATDGCGQLFWRKPRRDRMVSFDPMTRTVRDAWVLSESHLAAKLVIGRFRIWAGLVPNGEPRQWPRLRLYDAGTGQVIDDIALAAALGDPEVRLVDIAAAPDDEVAVVTAGAGGATSIVRFDASGRPLGTAKRLPDIEGPIAAAGFRTSRHLAVLDRGGSRLVLMAAGGAVPPVDLDVVAPAFRAGHVASDGWRHVYVVEAVASDPARGSVRQNGRTATIAAFDTDGRLVETINPGIGSRDLPVSAFAASRQGLYGSGPRGIFALARGRAGAAGRSRSALLITPPLESPEGKERGWARADLSVSVPRGATVEVAYANSDDRQLAAAIRSLLADAGLSPAAKVRRLDRRLASMWSPSRSYSAADAEPEETTVHVPLDAADHPFLWLRIALTVPAIDRPARLRRLRVRYPDLSYLRYLPALYAPQSRLATAADADPARSHTFRRYLAIFETVFGDLDETIDGLADLIHWQRAPDPWLDFIAGWLDVPLPDHLDEAAKRRLLAVVAEASARRGTADALRRTLSAVFNRPIRVVEAAHAARPLVLAGRSSAGGGATLGRDAILLGAGTARRRLGLGMRLGHARLRPPTPAEVLQRAQGTIRVEVPSDGATGDAAAVGDLIERFVPATVRVALRRQALPRAGGGRRIHETLRLGAVDPLVLDGTAGLGRAVLFGSDRGGARLEITSDLAFGFRLI